MGTNENVMYCCIDLKSFYASVECVERGLDPLTTNLVVADPERSDKTICLAVSPSLKKLGVKNRCRVFEIPKNIDYIMAPPRMQRYIDYAAEIYGVYLRYISKDDIFVYSIDEAFIDIGPYLSTYNMTPRQMAEFLMEKVYEEVGVRATAGVGTNLYLAKIALDITAKHAEDFIGYLDEESYRKELWNHRPLTDFWRIGRGIATRLEKVGLYTMGQIAKADEDLLYKMLGIDAELLIDHAWGIEPVTMKDIKAYTPKTKCLASGQVLMRDYEFEEGRLILREMAEALCLDMVRRGVKTNSMTVHVAYSRRAHLKSVRGTANVLTPTNVASVFVPELLKIYDDIVDRDQKVRHFNLYCNDLMEDDGEEQLTLFSEQTEERVAEDKKIQQAMLDIKDKFGKNAIFKSSDLKEGATALERNRQIGGHKSGE